MTPGTAALERGFFGRDDLAELSGELPPPMAPLLRPYELGESCFGSPASALRTPLELEAVGNQIFAHISAMSSESVTTSAEGAPPLDPHKITGMMLALPTEELEFALSSPEALRDAVAQANAVLAQALAAYDCAPGALRPAGDEAQLAADGAAEAWAEASSEPRAGGAAAAAEEAEQGPLLLHPVGRTPRSTLTAAMLAARPQMSEGDEGCDEGGAEGGDEAAAEAAAQAGPAPVRAPSAPVQPGAGSADEHTPAEAEVQSAEDALRDAVCRHDGEVMRDASDGSQAGDYEVGGGGGGGGDDGGGGGGGGDGDGGGRHNPSGGAHMARGRELFGATSSGDGATSDEMCEAPLGNYRVRYGEEAPSAAELWEPPPPREPSPRGSVGGHL